MGAAWKGVGSLPWLLANATCPPCLLPFTVIPGSEHRRSGMPGGGHGLMGRLCVVSNVAIAEPGRLIQVPVRKIWSHFGQSRSRDHVSMSSPAFVLGGVL